MNGPCGDDGIMYSVQRQYKRPEHFETSNSMYVVKSVVESCEIRSKTATSPVVVTPNLKMPAPAAKEGDLNQLEQRQERLFEQLEKLATKLKQIKDGLQQTPNLPAVALLRERVSKTTVATPNVPIMSQLNGCPFDVVVTLSVDHKPFALLILYKWLTRAGLNVSLGCHVHSSVHSPPVSLNKFLCDVAVPNKPETERSKQQLILTLIWKEGKDLTLIVSPMLHSNVTGEVNVLRYLASAFLPSLRYEDDPVKATEVDHWLDVAHSLAKHDGASRSKERHIVLRSLNSQLGQTEYLVAGSGPSVADVGMLSALFQESSSVADLPANVRKWVKLLCSDSCISVALRATSVELA